MSNRQWIWTALCILTIIIFFKLIPLDVYNDNSLTLSFAGGFIFFVTLFFALGDFTSIDEIISKVPPGTPENPVRKLSPAAVIPGFILVFVLVLYHSGQKKEELSKHGVLTKGTVIGGEATETTRRFKTNTSYSLIIAYKDSSGVKHKFDQSVNSSDFRDVYKGATVDVVYSKKLPSLASALFSVQELRKYIKVPDGKLTINDLIGIMEGTVKRDSVLQHLNSINYEWVKNEEEVYVNNKLDLAIKVFQGNEQIAYLEQSNPFGGRSSDFEESITSSGFKKKPISTNGQADETYYYNDKYMVSKERMTSDNNSTTGLYSSTVTTIYRVLIKEAE